MRNIVLPQPLKTMVAVLASCFVVCFVILPDICMAQQPSSLVDLLHAAEDRELAKSCNDTVLSIADLDRGDPTWPVHVFLRAEIHLLRDEPGKARYLYRKIVNWAASDPYGDTWGATSLAPVALWRWSSLCLDDVDISEDEISAILLKADLLLPTRFTLRLSRYGGLGRLPFIYEGTIGNLTKLAIIGDDPSAVEYLQTFLTVSREKDLPPELQNLFDNNFTGDENRSGRLLLERGRRLVDLREWGLAEKYFKSARDYKDPNISIVATFEYARLMDKIYRKSHRAEVDSLLGEVVQSSLDPVLITRSLYIRGRARNRSGKLHDYAGYLADYTQLFEEYPHSRYADDALYIIAMAKYWRGDTDLSLQYLSDLRLLDIEYDYWEKSFLQAAIILITRREDGDFEKAAQILDEYFEKVPDGNLKQACLFWRGRIHEELGETADAKIVFTRNYSENPLSWYGLRSQLHLTRGKDAAQQLHLDEEHYALIKARYEQEQCPEIIPDNPYSKFLIQVLDTGFYQEVINGRDHRRSLFPTLRLEQICLGDLDDKGIFPTSVLLHTLHQVALASAASDESSTSRIAVANAIVANAGDTSLAMSMMLGVGVKDDLLIVEQSKRTPGYLQAAYPLRFQDIINKYSVQYGLSSNMVYSVMRWESFLYPEAQSVIGALGLFQLTRRTFAALDEDWNLLESRGKSTREEFCYDPGLITQLWTRWYDEELIKSAKNNEFLALMMHHSGSGSVNKWLKFWKKMDIETDIELMIESARTKEARDIMKGVLESWEITEALGLMGRAQ